MRARKFADLVNEVQDRIDDFERAQQAVERARGALVNAEVELGNAKTRLDASRDSIRESARHLSFELRPAGTASTSSGEPATETGAFEVVEVDDEDAFPGFGGNIEFRERA